MHSTPADVAVAPSYHAANSTEWLHSCTAACVMHGAGRARLTAAAEAGVGRDRAHEAPLVRCPVARHRLVQVALKRQDAVLLRLLRRRGKEGARTSKPRWATLWQASSGQLPDKRAASSLHAQSLAGCMHAVGLLCTCPPPPAAPGWPSGSSSPGSAPGTRRPSRCRPQTRLRPAAPAPASRRPAAACVCIRCS